MSNIYLIGMMGSGKSATGKNLAGLLGYAFVDLDERIEEKAHRSISEIFEKEGEAYFRAQEAEALRESSAGPKRVVATGGGTILREENVARMHQTGKMVYLETSLDMLWQRVRHKKDRPLLKQADPKEALRLIFETRKPLYERVCDFQVSTDDQTAEAVALKIAERLKGTA